MRLASRSTLVLMLSIATALAARRDNIGSWVLSCSGETPSSEQCSLRLDKRLIDEGEITGQLEIQAVGQSLVPVIALRGLPAQVLFAAALAAKADASMQFGDGPRQDLTCAADGAAYICSPRGDAARALAAGLPDARSVTVRISVTVTGLNPLPARTKSFDLSGTRRALMRMRALVPAPAPASTTGLTAMADKALRAAGYPNGVADLQDLITKYRGK